MPLDYADLDSDGEQLPPTVTMDMSDHRPQSVAMIVTTNSLGRCGRPILLKPIRGLDVDGIKKIQMRTLTFSAGAGPSAQGQLWVYNPARVSNKATWTEYYSVVLPDFIAECRAAVTPPVVPGVLEDRTRRAST